MDWSKYERQIYNLSLQGLGSPRILKRLREEHGDIFPLSAERKIRKLTKKFKESNEKQKSELFDNSHKWEEDKEGAVWEYNTTEKPLKTLEDALHFCEADLEKFEVDRYIFNSWDVTMKQLQPDKTVKPIKATNYQVKVWFKKIIPIQIREPFLKDIFIKPDKKVEMWVIIGCVHRPFHNKKLWDALLAFLQHYRNSIDGFIINGDFLDLRSLSKHEEWVPEGIDLGYEYSDGLQGISELNQALEKKTKKWFIWGNHEDRYKRDKVNLRRYGSAVPTPEEALKLEEFGYEVIDDWKDGFITLGNDLEVFHGEYISVDAAKKHLQMMPTKSCIFNHTHRHQTFTMNNQTAYNIGWLGDVKNDVFKYAMRRSKYQWMNGLGVVYIDTDGTNHVTSIKCPENKIFFEGKIFKG